MVKWNCSKCKKELDTEITANLCGQCPECAYGEGGYFDT